MKRKQQFIFVCGDGVNNFQMLDDLKNEKDVDVFVEKKEKPGILNLLSKIHYSRKINRLVHLPFHFSCSKFWRYFKKKYNKKDTDYFIVIFNGAYRDFEECVWNGMNKRKNVHLFLVLIDSLGVKTKTAGIIKRMMEKVKWEKIFSYDKSDAIKYGLDYLDEMYYSDKRKDQDEDVKYDTYFIGRLKPGRQKQINVLFEFLKGKGLKNDFEIWLPSEDSKHYDKNALIQGVNYFKKSKTYDEVLREVQRANCIIELMQVGQQAPSLRYFEAVVFNKKLLTNNKNVINLNYYDPKYIKIFEKPEDIDVEWLKKRDKVDYDYRGEFSPRYLVDKIRKMYE